MTFTRRTLSLLIGSAMAITLSGAAIAQTKPCETQPAQPKPCNVSPGSAAARMEAYNANRVLKPYYLAHASRFQQSEANEILIALRNVLDIGAKIYLVPSQNAIVLSAPPDQQELAQKVIAELDLPRKSYRLTFTVEEFDGSKRGDAHHFSLNVVSGQRSVLKQGSKVPIITSMYNPNGQSAENEFQYLDVGMNFDTTLEYTPGGLDLQFKIEQSSVADEHMSGALSSEPIVHQTVLQGMSALAPGKSTNLGSIDVAGTTRRLDVEVVAQPIS